MTSYYDVLGVAIDADLEEVRRAYLRKAQQLHPDRHAGSPEPERRRAEAEMKALNEAWSTLNPADGRAGPRRPTASCGRSPSATPRPTPSTARSSRRRSTAVADPARLI